MCELVSRLEVGIPLNNNPSSLRLSHPVLLRISHRSSHSIVPAVSPPINRRAALRSSHPVARRCNRAAYHQCSRQSSRHDIQVGSLARYHLSVQHPNQPAYLQGSQRDSPPDSHPEFPVDSLRGNPFAGHRHNQVVSLEPVATTLIIAFNRTINATQ